MAERIATTTTWECDGCSATVEFPGTLDADDYGTILELRGIGQAEPKLVASSVPRTDAPYNWTRLRMVPMNDSGLRHSRLKRPRRLYCLACFEKVLRLLDGRLG